MAEGVRVATVGRWAARLAATFKLRRLIAEKKYDIVHTHEAHGLTAAWLAGAHSR